SEQSAVTAAAGDVRIEFEADDGDITVLKESTPLLDSEVIDAAVMNRDALREFIADAMNEAASNNILLSLHLKATMMKVSDPIMFGHAVTVYYQDVFEKHADVFDEIGVDPNNGIGDVCARLSELPDDKRAEIEADLQAVYAARPALAMV
ncbi:MAG: NADP-dependent isocitrate dehydrogenase, partial [Woeseiales bacterium]